MGEGKLLAEWFWTDRWMGSRGFLLPLEPRGLYREMLTQAWRRGGSLPVEHDAIRRATGCTLEEWERCWPLVEPFWEERDGELVNETQIEVMAKARRIKEVRSAAGRKGGKASGKTRKKKEANAQANDEAKTNPPSPISVSVSSSPSLSPEPSPKEALAPSGRSRGYTAAFEAFWKRYPAGNSGLKGSKKKAFEHWRRLKLEEQAAELVALIPLFEKTNQWREGKIPYPQKWLNEQLYETPPDNNHPHRTKLVADVPPGSPYHGHSPGDDWEDDGFVYRITSDNRAGRRPKDGQWTASSWEPIAVKEVPA